MRKSQLSVWEYKRLQQSETKEKLNKKKKDFRKISLRRKMKRLAPHRSEKTKRLELLKIIKANKFHLFHN